MTLERLSNEEILFDCSNEIEKYKCRTCPNFQTDFGITLKQHIGGDHSDESPQKDHYTCLKCLFVTRSKFLMMRHSFFDRCARRYQDDVQSPINFTLKDECKFSFHGESEDANPLKSGQYFTKAGALSNWESPTTSLHSNVGDIQWFQCEECPSKFKNRRDLGRHVIARHTHPDDIRWKDCPHCPYKSKELGNLRTHIKLRHSKPEDIQWFQCEQCTSKFKLKTILREHVKACHSRPEDIQWFECGQCPSKFKRKFNLKRHVIAYHTQVEDIPWRSCPHCSHKCKSDGNLKTHIRLRHSKPEDVRWFQCGRCPSKFKAQTSLKKHLAKCHVKPEIQLI